jgi:hypothetical protein
MPVPAMPAASDPSEVPGAADDWDMVAVHRRGAPPLRFAGREVCRAEDGGAWVRIWQVRSGGFVLAHAVEEGQIAERFPSAEAAMTALEAYCARTDRLGNLLEPPPRLDLADLLEEIARLMEWRRRFGVMAGEALDRFDSWLRQETGCTGDRP